MGLNQITKVYNMKHGTLRKKKIKEYSNNIRNKFLTLKRAEQDETISDLSPIADSNVKPNRSNSRDQGTQTWDVEEEIRVFPHQQQKTSVRSLKNVVTSDVNIQQRDDNLLKHNQAVLAEFLKQFPPLSQDYIKGYFTNGEEYDTSFGVRFDIVNNRMLLGGKQLHICENNELILDDRAYMATKGIYELIFMKKPYDYTEEDLKNYRDILELSNAHKRHYRPEERMKGNRSFKYLNIIKPLFAQNRLQFRFPALEDVATSHSSEDAEPPLEDSNPAHKDEYEGDAMGCGSKYKEIKRPLFRSLQSKITKPSGSDLSNSTTPMEYVYWDDPNDLVDRLRVLIVSKDAGDASHTNEISAIINELKKAGIIY